MQVVAEIAGADQATAAVLTPAHHPTGMSGQRDQATVASGGDGADDARMRSSLITAATLFPRPSGSCP